MSFESNLPRRVHVKKVISSRYSSGERPLSWDERVAGIEEIQAEDGELVVLFSNGGQSTPKPGWDILLTQPHRSAQASQLALEWTLYGIPKQDRGIPKQDRQ